MDLDIERDFPELHPKSRARLVIDDAPIPDNTGGIDPVQQSGINSINGASDYMKGRYGGEKGSQQINLFPNKYHCG